MIVPTRKILASLLALAMLGAPADEPTATPAKDTASAPAAIPSKSADTPVPSRKASSPRAKAIADNEAKTDDLAARFSQDVILQALSFIGVNYKWGGASAEKGLDCSGFIMRVFQQTMSISLPHNAFAISLLGDQVDRNELAPGDLVFFNTLGRKFSHVGIYMGDDRFIHAPRTGASVQVVKFSDEYWTKRFNGARRLTKESYDARSPMLQMLMREGEKEQNEGKKGKSAKNGKSAGKGGKSTAPAKKPKKKH
ncbi:C40 family peptidase [Burkholderiaceae bacterium DAT-1]|nr:C40 family peptidase [Burkholderiaceae bacterium DAT-1]